MDHWRIKMNTLKQYLVLSEAESKMLWKVSSLNEERNYLTLTDEKGTYYAKFIQPKEDHVAYYMQGSSMSSKGLSFAAGHNKKSEFKSLKELNEFLSKNELPAVSAKQYKEMKNDSIVVSIRATTTHYFQIKESVAKDILTKSEDEAEFLKSMTVETRKVAGVHFKREDLSKESIEMLKNAFKSKKFPKY